MADKVDASLNFGTGLDTEGFEKDSQKLKKAVEDFSDSVKTTGIAANGEFSKMLGFVTRIVQAMNAANASVRDTAEAMDAEGEKEEKPTAKLGLRDAESVRKSAEQAEKAVRRLNDQIDKLNRRAEQGINTQEDFDDFTGDAEKAEDSLEQAKKKLEEFGNTKIKSSSFGTVARQIESIDKELQDLESQKQSLELNDLTEGDPILEETYNNLLERIEKLNAEKRKLSEIAYIDPKQTAEFQRMSMEITKQQQRIEELKKEFNGDERAAKGFADFEDAISRGTEEAKARLDSPLKSLSAAFERLTGEALSAGSAAKQAFKLMTVTPAKLGFKALMKSVRGVVSLFKSLKSHISGAHSGADKLLRGLTSLKTMLVSRIKRSFVSYLMQTITDSIHALAKYDAAFDRAVSTIRNRTKELGANITVALGGLVKQIEPIITRIINALSSAVAHLNAVIAAIRGEKTMEIAAKQTGSYADSLDGAADSAKSAAKEQKRLNAQLMGFDELHRLEDNSSSDDTGSGSGADVFNTVRTQSMLNDMSDLGKRLSEDFINAVKQGDWYSAGEAVASGINSIVERARAAVQSARPKMEEAATALAEGLNGLVENLKTEEIGGLVGDGISNALVSFNTFYDKFSFTNLGVKLGQGVNGLADSFKWEELGKAVGNGVNSISNIVNGLSDTIKWEKIGTDISTGFNEMVDKIDFADAGTAFSNVIKDPLTTISATLENINWPKLAEGVADFVRNIDFAGIADALFEAIGAALGGLASFFISLIGEALLDLEEWWKGELEKVGGNVVAGIFVGIWDAIKGIGTWIYNHIFLPFINGFKKAFGIHSPSKEMESMGGLITDGLLGGIVNGLKSIGTWIVNNIFTPIWNGLRSSFGFVAGGASKIAEIGGDIIGGIKDGIAGAVAGIATWIKTEIFGPIWRGIRAAFGFVVSGGSKLVELGTDLITHMKDGITGALKGIANWVKVKIGDPIINKAKEVFGGFKNIGKDLINGLKDGISEQWDKVKDTVGGVFTKVTDAAKKLFGIHSPSRVFRDQVGAQLTAGMALGIEDGSKGVLHAASDLAANVTDRMDVSAPKIDLAAESTVSGLDAVAAKLGAIAAQFRAISLAIPDVALGAVVPVRTRIPDDKAAGKDGELNTLLEKLIELLSDGSPRNNPPVRITVPVSLDRRQIALATADYNAASGRITNGGLR